MKHLDGKRIGGDHTTFIELAGEVSDKLLKISGVDKVSPGYIQAGIGSGRGTRSVKIIDDIGSVLLKIKQSGSAQEVRVFTKDPQNIKLELAKWLRDQDIEIGFGDRT